MQQNLKTYKSSKGMRYLTSVLIVFSILMLSSQSVNAMYYHQSIYPDLIDNHTIRYYTIVQNTRTDTILTDRLDNNNGFSNPTNIILSLFDFNFLVNQFSQNYGATTEDLDAWNVGETSDKFPYQFFIKYSIYPKSFNDQAGYDLIAYCDINVTKSVFSSTLLGIPSTANEQLLYKRVVDDNLYNQEYYIELARGDSAYTKIDCYFTNQSQRTYIVPVDLYVNSPTYSCSKCQAYQWSTLQPTILKADFLLQANTNNVDYIKKIVYINYEFAVIFYWFILILAVVFAVGLLFLGGYWLYLWLTKLIR